MFQEKAKLIDKTMTEKNKKGRAPKDKGQDTNTSKGERIAKRIARSGMCSRREAERWIEAGRVKVNSETLKTPACVVTSADKIMIDGKPLAGAEKTRLFLYHKPAGLVTTNKDEYGRKTIFDSFPPDLPRVITVGRLDMNTEGLLLLTNDGELARHLELPSTGWVRKYRVRIHGTLKDKHIALLKKGMRVDGVQYGSIVAEPDPSSTEKSGSNSWITISLQEGKNREIRRVMDALELPVNRLIRLSYGPFQLGKLPKGAIKEMTPKSLSGQLPEFF